MIESIGVNFEAVKLPWLLQGPHRLISWYEMEQFSARGFFQAGCLMEGIKQECLMASMMLDPEEPVYNLAARLDMGVIERATKYLRQIEKECRGIGLPISADTVKDAVKNLEDGRGLLNYQWLRDKVSDLKKLIVREMSGHGFYYISPERGKYWPMEDSGHAFGKNVGDAFSSSFMDAGQAGVCLAVGLPTASVFHSMRVLEIGLRTFGATFGVSMGRRNWEPVISEIESKIGDMHIDPAWKALPDCKDKQEKYSQAASHFSVMKGAWRNYTMHGRGPHGGDEAELIFLNLRAFMQKLAALGLKEES
jgi:hypothetical protein